MISELSIRRFKGFASLDLELGYLTVLTGLNSAGKTSVIHALLLLREALRGGSVVALNGPDGLALGEPFDVLHRGSGDETIELQVRSDAGHDWLGVTLSVPSDRAMHLERTDEPREDTPLSCGLAGPEPTFTYLCAERLGPRDTQSARASHSDSLSVGVFGQHTAQVLAALQRREVDEDRWVPSAESLGADRFLLSQSELWMSRILGSAGRVRIDARWLDGTSVTSLRFQMPGQQAEWTRPQNVGFGVSYALPIVVAALQAPKGGLLIIENPEAHLHPAGQSAIGAFLAQIAASGVQVIMETHSDHVINGIRCAIAERRVTLDAEKAAVLYFHPDAPGEQRHERIHIRETGELSAWPPGFFDQTQRDLAALARVKRRPQ